MLGMKSYSKEYIAACRSKIDSDLAAYGRLPEAVKRVDGFESTFFNNLVLILDYLFVHRLASIDGKDGNPLNEVRVLSDSMLSNDNTMTSGTVGKSSQMRFNKAIKLTPETSVLKYTVGDEIKLNEADFVLLFNAFFAEL